jgi:hypothetical protein
MHDGVESDVGEAILRLAGLDAEGAAQVVLAAAPDVQHCTQSLRIFREVSGFKETCNLLFRVNN